MSDLWTIGDTASETFSTGIAGQTFARSSSRINGSTVTWNPTFTDLTGGNYRYSYVTAAIGNHEWAGDDGAGYPIAINFRVLSTSGALVVVTRAPDLSGPSFSLVPGDDYLAADGRQLGPFVTQDAAEWPDLTGALVEWEVGNTDGVSFAVYAYGTILQPTGATKSVQVELTRDVTRMFAPGNYSYLVRARLASGSQTTLRSGALTFTKG